MFSNCIDHLKAQPPWILLLSLLGFLSLLKNSILLLTWIFITFLRPSKDLKSYGSWALVTGATGGIGKAFAFQLAREGLNLILVGRNSGKLRQVSGDILSMYPNTEVKSIELDFSGDVAGGVRKMAAEITDLDVGVLINNVGVTYPGAMFFHEVEERVWREVVRVNSEGTTYVTAAVVRGMVRRKRGAIVNIGSGAAIVVPSHPLYAVYAATKAYIDQLSRSMYVEYKHYGIDIQCQVPLYVWTKMTSDVASIEKPSLFIPSAQDYVRSAARHIGYRSRCTPYWAHSVQWFFASLLPESLLDSWRLSIGLRRMKKKYIY